MSTTHSHRPLRFRDRIRIRALRKVIGHANHAVRTAALSELRKILARYNRSRPPFSWRQNRPARKPRNRGGQRVPFPDTLRDIFQVLRKTGRGARRTWNGTRKAWRGTRRAGRWFRKLSQRAQEPVLRRAERTAARRLNRQPSLAPRRNPSPAPRPARQFRPSRRASSPRLARTPARTR